MKICKSHSKYTGSIFHCYSNGLPAFLAISARRSGVMLSALFFPLLRPISTVA